MTTLTIELPETINQQLQAYGISQQHIQSLITDFVENYLRQYQAQHTGDGMMSSPTFDPLLAPPPLPPEVEATLAKLDSLGNKELWNIAHSALKQADLNELERLSGHQGADVPTPVDDIQGQELLNRYDQAVLKRAKAMAILKQRGEDISPLLKQPVVS